MSHGERASFLKNKFKGFWKRRPLSGYSSIKKHKQIVNRIERREQKQKIKEIKMDIDLPPSKKLEKRQAIWTYDKEANTYYFKPKERTSPPYVKQIIVEAIIDIADDDTFSGIEIIDPKIPKPKRE